MGQVSNSDGGDGGGAVGCTGPGGFCGHGRALRPSHGQPCSIQLVQAGSATERMAATRPAVGHSCPLVSTITASPQWRPGFRISRLVGPDGNFLVNVNATPQEGDERLAGWAEFRIGHLRGDDASSVHEESEAEGLAFRSGRGSCVIDDYVTKVGHHSFHEIACLVEGAKGGSVIVAVAPSPAGNSVNATLERAVSSYLVR